MHGEADDGAEAHSDAVASLAQVPARVLLPHALQDKRAVGQHRHAARRQRAVLRAAQPHDGAGQLAAHHVLVLARVISCEIYKKKIIGKFLLLNAVEKTSLHWEQSPVDDGQTQLRRDQNRKIETLGQHSGAA